MRTPNPLRRLRAEIDRFIRRAGGFELPGLRREAERAEKRIALAGFRWDPKRQLWRDLRPWRSRC